MPTIDISKWPDIIRQQRQKYSELHRTLIDIPKEQIEASKIASKVPTDATTNNPLGLNDDVSNISSLTHLGTKYLPNKHGVESMATTLCRR
jgi:hypothetical protein